MTPQRPLIAVSRQIRSIAIRTAGRMTGGSPVLRRMLGFYPEAGWPSAERVEILHKTSHVFAWTRAEFEMQRNSVFENNIDHCASSTWPHDGSAQRLVALVRNVEAPGHSIVAVDPATGRIVHPDAWDAGDCRASGPSPGGIIRRTASTDPTLLVPRTDCYDRLVAEGLTPLLFALAECPLGAERRINIVTRRRPQPIVTAFIEALGTEGYRVTHLRIGRYETLRIPLYLHVSSHTRNRENLFAVPEAIAPARRLLARIPADAAPSRPGGRVFMRARYGSRARIAEAGDLAERLSRSGFEIVDADWRNAHESMLALRHASVVVAASGDGLSNILWAAPGALLIEIMPDGARTSAGLHLASAAGALHHPLFWNDAQTLDADDVDAFVRRIVALAHEHALKA